MELSSYEKLEYIRTSLNTIIDILVVDKPSRFFYIEKVLEEFSPEYNDWCIQKPPMDKIKVVLTKNSDDDGFFVIEWISSEITAKATIRPVVNFLDSELDIKDPQDAYDVDMTYARLVELFKYSEEELRLYLKLKNISGIVRETLL